MNWTRFMFLLSDASQDLFSSEWTEGNLYTIQPVVEKLGAFSCWAISIVGFGIVIFSILKNALSGLYVVNPTFWDKVDQVKTQAVAGVGSTVQQYSGGNAATQKLGGLFVFLLGLIPNIRALTDFDDGAPVDKKQYFMKSIPLLVAQIFIGMMIFFGYPSKIANWIGSGATYAMSAIINNIDPVQVVSKVSNSFTVYNLSTDGSQDPLEQNINKMASDMTSVMATKYNDMDKTNVQNVALVIEQNLISAFDDEGIREVLGSGQGYVVSISTTIQGNEPSVSAAYKSIGSQGVKQAQANNGTVSYKYWVSASSILTGQHTTKLGANDYMVWSVTATPVAVADISTANLIVFAGFNGTPSVDGTEGFSVTIQGITVGKLEGDIKGTLGKVVVVEAIDANGTNIGTFNATLQTASVTQQAGATAVLKFAASDRSTFSSVAGSCSYLRVNLTGDWSKTVSATGGGSTTVRITELRLKNGVTSASYALSSWTDVDLKTDSSSVTTLTSDTLKKSSMAN